MTNRTAAVRYARALFDVNLESGDLQKAESDLDLFARLVVEHEGLRRVLFAVAVQPPKKRAIINDLRNRLREVSPTVTRLLTVLADRGRLALLPDILRFYRARVFDHLGVVDTEVTTAQPLSPARTPRCGSGSPPRARATCGSRRSSIRSNPMSVTGTRRRGVSLPRQGRRARRRSGRRRRSPPTSAACRRRRRTATAGRTCTTRPPWTGQRWPGTLLAVGAPVDAPLRTDGGTLGPRLLSTLSRRGEDRLRRGRRDPAPHRGGR